MEGKSIDIKCPRCAEFIKAEAKICRFCNYEFTKKCIYCLEEIKSEAIVCRYCGKEQSNNALPQPSTEELTLKSAADYLYGKKWKLAQWQVQDSILYSGAFTSWPDNTKFWYTFLLPFLGGIILAGSDASSIGVILGGILGVIILFFFLKPRIITIIQNGASSISIRFGKQQYKVNNIGEMKKIINGFPIETWKGNNNYLIGLLIFFSFILLILFDL